MKNYRQKVIDELLNSGYELLRNGKHGDIYKHPSRPSVMVARTVDTRKLAEYIIRKASQPEP